MERWDFASGMLHPHWRLESRGVYSAHAFGHVQAPTLEVVDLLCLNGTCADGATEAGEHLAAHPQNHKHNKPMKE